MNKIEIEIANGKVANVINDGNKIIVTLDKINPFDLKDIGSVKIYIGELANTGVKWAYDLWKEYQATVYNSYSEKICLYHMVVAALTNNEEYHLITGERWFPIAQFCEPGKENYCMGNEIIGTIESEGQKYTVVSGGTFKGGNSGIGCFSSFYGVGGAWTGIGFRAVASKEIAKHISKYFGRLLFDIIYSGINCNWKWIK